MQNSPVRDDLRAVFNAAYRVGAALGRKFEASDMTPELRQAASLYAANYECRPENDDFMRDMQSRVSIPGFLSDGQSKGVLNVLMADARRRMAAKPKATSAVAPAPAATPVGPNLASVPDGRYRITLADGSDLALRFESKNEWIEEKFGKGTRKLALRVGGSDSEREWNGVGTISTAGTVSLWKSAGPRVAAAVDMLANASRDEQGWLVFGLAFAEAGSVCFRCGKELDQPESLLVGYGEACADRMGLPWGKKATPMSVLLARAGQDAPALVPVTEGPLANHPDFEFVQVAPAEPTYTKEEEDEFMALAAPKHDAYAEGDRVNRETNARIQAIKASGRKPTYEDIFGEDSD